MSVIRDLVGFGATALVAAVVTTAAPVWVWAEAEASRARPAATVEDLLEGLASAPDEATAAGLRKRIEAMWMASGSATADLLALRAAALSAHGDPGAAADLLDAAMVLAPDWASGHWARAVVRAIGGARAGARVDLQAAIRLEPRHFPALTALASVMLQEGRPAEALALLRRAAAVDPRDADRAALIERLTLEVEGREL